MGIKITQSTTKPDQPGVDKKTMQNIDQIFEGLPIPPVPQKQVVDLLEKAGLFGSIEEDNGDKRYPDKAAKIVSRYLDLLFSGMKEEMALEHLEECGVSWQVEINSGSSQPASEPKIVKATEAETFKPVVDVEPVREEKTPIEIVGGAPEGNQEEVVSTTTQSREGSVELSELKELIQATRDETISLLKASSERIRDLDEERRNARERIARLEEKLHERKPVDFWSRIRSAWQVLRGELKVVPALPAESMASRNQGEFISRRRAA